MKITKKFVMIVIVIMLMIIFNCALGPRHLTKVMFNTDNEDHEEDCYDCNCALGSSILPALVTRVMPCPGVQPAHLS